MRGGNRRGPLAPLGFGAAAFVASEERVRREVVDPVAGDPVACPNMVRWSSPLGSLGRLTRWVVTAGALFALLGGGLAGAFHDHANHEPDGHCVVCALVGTPADSSPAAPTIAPALPAITWSAPPVAKRTASAESRLTFARAPPIA